MCACVCTSWCALAPACAPHSLLMTSDHQLWCLWASSPVPAAPPNTPRQRATQGQDCPWTVCAGGGTAALPAPLQVGSEHSVPTQGPESPAGWATTQDAGTSPGQQRHLVAGLLAGLPQSGLQTATWGGTHTCSPPRSRTSPYGSRGGLCPQAHVCPSPQSL